MPSPCNFDATLIGLVEPPLAAPATSTVFKYNFSTGCFFATTFSKVLTPLSTMKKGTMKRGQVQKTPTPAERTDQTSVKATLDTVEVTFRNIATGIKRRL